MTTTVVRLAAEVAAGKQLPSSLTIKTNKRYGGQVQQLQQHQQQQQQQPHPYAVTANSNTISNRPVRIRSVATSVIVAPIACAATTTTTAATHMDDADEELEELEEQEEELDEMEQEDQEALEDQEEAQVAAANGLLAWSRAAANQQQAQAVLMQG